MWVRVTVCVNVWDIVIQLYHMKSTFAKKFIHFQFCLYDDGYWSIPDEEVYN